MDKLRKMLFIYLMLFLAIIPAASGAKIFGNVYDFSSLEILDKVLVEINTQPIQRIISDDGYYSFDVQQGNYTISAFYVKLGKVELSADESITINSDGEFEFDLILFPPLGEIDSMDELLNADIENQIDENALKDSGSAASSSQDILFPLLLFVLIILISFGFYYWNKNKKTKLKPEKSESDVIELSKDEEKIEKSQEMHLDDSAKEVLKAIKESGNRLTQKELRDKIPSMGEAKISLIVAELESLGLIKKIKKGRGNIIVLKP